MFLFKSIWPLTPLGWVNPRWRRQWPFNVGSVPTVDDIAVGCDIEYV